LGDVPGGAGKPPPLGGHTIPPKTQLGQAIGYRFGQKLSLRRCLTEQPARRKNNLDDQTIKPLRLGAKNWI
jgi:hypothetical protein